MIITFEKYFENISRLLGSLSDDETLLSSWRYQASHVSPSNMFQNMNTNIRKENGNKYLETLSTTITFSLVHLENLVFPNLVFCGRSRSLLTIANSMRLRNTKMMQVAIQTSIACKHKGSSGASFSQH